MTRSAYRPTSRKGGKATPVADEWEQTAIPLEDLGEAEHRGIPVDIPQAPTRYYGRPTFDEGPAAERAKDIAKDMARDVKVGTLVRIDPTGGGHLPGTWSVWCGGGAAQLLGPHPLERRRHQLGPRAGRHPRRRPRLVPHPRMAGVTRG